VKHLFHEEIVVLLYYIENNKIIKYEPKNAEKFLKIFLSYSNLFFLSGQDRREGCIDDKIINFKITGVCLSIRHAFDVYNKIYILN